MSEYKIDLLWNVNRWQNSFNSRGEPPAVEMLQELGEYIETSTPNTKIQAVIDAHKKNKVGDGKLDYADDLIVMTLERILKGDL